MERTGVVGGKLQLKGSNKLKEKSKKKKKKSKDKRKKESLEEDLVETSGLTEAQKRHKKFKLKRQEEELKTVASKTYREHVEDYNQYLEGLTEHHDVPKVSAAGNG